MSIFQKGIILPSIQSSNLLMNITESFGLKVNSSNVLILDTSGNTTLGNTYNSTNMNASKMTLISSSLSATANGYTILSGDSIETTLGNTNSITMINGSNFEVSETGSIKGASLTCTDHISGNRFIYSGNTITPDSNTSVLAPTSWIKTNFPTISSVNSSLSDINNDILTNYAKKSDVNISHNDIITNYAKKTDLENSIYTVNTSINDIITNYAKKEDVNASINTVNNSINGITVTYAKKEDVNASFNSVNNSITDITTNYAKKDNVNASFNSVNNSITDITTNYAKKTYVDTSISNTSTSLKNYIDGKSFDTTGSYTWTGANQTFSGSVYAQGILYVGLDNLDKTEGSIGGEIRLQGTYGDNYTDHCRLFTNLYKLGESSELVIHKGNDGDDRIRMCSSILIFDCNGTFTQTPNTKMTLDVNGCTVVGTMNATTFNATSDKRLKTKIADLDRESSLNTLRQLKPKKYDFMDIPDQLGFIAQEIQEIEILNPAVNTDGKGFIPNITQSVICKDGWFLINYPLKIFDKIQYKQYDQYIPTTIIAYEKGKYQMDTPITGEIFIYGTEIDDLHSIQKDMVFTIAVSAIQRLDEVVLKQQEQLNEQKIIIEKQQKMIESILSKLNSS